jgi:hypothetical protein
MLRGSAVLIKRHSEGIVHFAFIDVSRCLVLLVVIVDVFVFLRFVYVVLWPELDHRLFIVRLFELRRVVIDVVVYW